MYLLAFTFLFTLSNRTIPNTDTTDWWHVSYNNKIVTEYPVYPKNPPVVINKQIFRDNDTVSITYGNDTPCWECNMGIYIFDTHKKKIILAANKRQALFKLSVKDVIHLMNHYSYKETNVYYFDSRRNVFLFSLKIQ